MGKLIYNLNVSLDGFIETPDHSLDWTVVDDELHRWFNEQTRTLDATLYGRRLWEVMAAHWPTGEDDPSATDATREFAVIWNAMPKIVFSTSLESVEHGARLVRGDVGEVLDWRQARVRRRHRRRRCRPRRAVRPARTRRRVSDRRPPGRDRCGDSLLAASRRAD